MNVKAHPDDKMSKMLDDLYLPDGKRLTTQIVGKPGGGKSFYLRETLMQFLKKNDDPDRS